MKAVLGCLLCLLLTTAQTFALKGGPVYPAGTNIVGTYAGVLQPTFCPRPNPAECGDAQNSIGIFSLGVPSTGNASGNFVMFSRGRVFTGTAQAFGDPQKATLKGIVSATYNYSLYVPVTETDENGTTTTRFETLDVTATAAGPLSAKIANSKSSSFGLSTTLLRGEATLNITGGVNATGEPVVTATLGLTVTGVKQSNSVTVAAPVSGG